MFPHEQYPSLSAHAAALPHVDWAGLGSLVGKYAPGEVAIVESLAAAVTSKNFAAVATILVTATPQQIAIIKEVLAALQSTPAAQ
jgi:hypothetical protein